MPVVRNERRPETPKSPVSTGDFGWRAGIGVGFIGAPSGAGEIVGFVAGVLITAAALVIPVWFALLGLAAFLGLRLVYRTVGLHGHSLVGTFLQAPAAPPWTEYGRKVVVRIPVPPGVTTLGIEPGVDLRAASNAARCATLDAFAPAREEAEDSG